MPEGDTWFVTDARLLANNQKNLFVSIYDTETYDFGVVKRPGIPQVLPQAKAVTAERGAAIAELLVGAEVTVGPRHRDGTWLPDAVQVRLGFRVTTAVYEPADPGAAAYQNAIDRWQLTFDVKFPAIVSDSMAPDMADYTFAEFDEVSITVPRRRVRPQRP
ncbi:MAG: hypothetical protein OXI74_06310 [Rhodospirillaceae bacterium]|nr:hypothetical protein [Rhodospirillaceae bacterium]